MHAAIFALMLLTMITVIAVTPAYLISSVVLCIPARFVCLCLWIADGREYTLDRFRVSSIYQSILDWFSDWESENASATPECTECEFFSPHLESCGRTGLCWRDSVTKEVPEMDAVKRIGCFTYRKQDNGTVL